MNKKRNIIRTATHLFAEQGFEGTTTFQISKEADVTEPLILYYHFKGKEELCSHILDTSFKKHFFSFESTIKTLPNSIVKFIKMKDMALSGLLALCSMWLPGRGYKGEK